VIPPLMRDGNDNPPRQSEIGRQIGTCCCDASPAAASLHVQKIIANSKRSARERLAKVPRCTQTQEKVNPASRFPPSSRQHRVPFARLASENLVLEMFSRSQVGHNLRFARENRRAKMKLT
jgi:hypothetical protein